MTDRPLVSIITPSIPSRGRELGELIANLDAQTYPNVEHIVVGDGPHPGLQPALAVGRLAAEGRRRVFELGRWWTKELSDSYAAAPIIVGQLMARGEYACLWSDDERATDPDHLSKMVDLIESSGATFVYPIVDFWWHNRPNDRTLIWADPPILGSITHWMYRPSMIEHARGPYRTHVGRANDWEFIERAMRGGATSAMLPEITFSHRADD